MYLSRFVLGASLVFASNALANPSPLSEAAALFPETTERPLFSASRRPVAVETPVIVNEEPKVVAVVAPAKATPRFDESGLELHAVFGRVGALRALVHDTRTSSYIELVEGVVQLDDGHGKTVDVDVLAIEPGYVTLKADRALVLTLRDQVDSGVVKVDPTRGVSTPEVHLAATTENEPKPAEMFPDGVSKEARFVIGVRTN